MTYQPSPFMLDLFYAESLPIDQCAGCLQEPHPGVHCSEVASAPQIKTAAARRAAWQLGFEAGLKVR